MFDLEVLAAVDPRADESALVRGVEAFVAPTGARYRCTAPPLPGAPLITVSDVEIRIGVAITDLHAA
jgi:hypothetical protein